MKALLQLTNKIAKFFKLSWQEKVLLIDGFFLSGIFRFVILFLPFNNLVEFVGKYKEESSEEISDINKVTINKIGWAVAVVSRITPWESKCFVQALTAQRMLKKRKIDSTLYLGVAKNKQKKLLAHAWLRSGKIIVTGGLGCNSFTEVMKFSSKVRGRK
ncbi:lasso peptide biosynthesis B2 protein [Clostridium drakei]|nr:lasso peptide biosynthesis B2 protein [Clostridium drakei]